MGKQYSMRFVPPIEEEAVPVDMTQFVNTMAGQWRELSRLFYKAMTALRLVMAERAQNMTREFAAAYRAIYAIIPAEQRRGWPYPHTSMAAKKINRAIRANFRRRRGSNG